ncbi:MAG: hypothetical protein JW810_06740 [Sedimentisphaerales bacterium]|nr:hypothetical protein [Sedimentisphaerales bacterium]
MERQWRRLMQAGILTCILAGTAAQAGLQVHLPLDGNLNDVAGSPNHGTLVDGSLGTHQYVTGKIDQGLELSGTHATINNDYLSIPYTLTDAGSMALWFEPAAIYNYNTILDNVVEANDWEMWIYATGEYAGRIESPQYVRGYWMTPGQWYHVIMTWTRNTADPSKVDNALYINGEFVTSNTNGNWVDPGNTVYLGGGHSGNNAGDGIWDDVRIYDHALTEEEIAELVPRRKLAVDPVSLDLTEGGSSTYTVALDYSSGAEPTHEVTVEIRGEPNLCLNGQAAGTTISLLFETGSYNTPQIVAVAAVDDEIKQGDRNITLTHSVHSQDANWDAAEDYDSTVYIYDNDYGVEDCGIWGYADMDFNRDCYVNLADYALFVNQWLHCTHPADKLCRPVTSDRVVVVAHRGYSAAAPENTIASCNASRGYADMVEFDVRDTVDGHLILMHDATVDRTTNGIGSVAAMTFNELRALDAGSWFSPEFTGELVPLMTEAILACRPDMVPFIERKTGDAQHYVDLIRSLRMEEKVIIISFDWDFLEDVETLAPGIKTGALGSGELTAGTIQNIQAQGIDFIDWAHDSVSAATIDLVHGYGMEFHVWTVNNAGRMTDLISWGIDGITTDNPELLQDVLDN